MKLRTETEKLAGRIYFKFNAGSRLRTDIQTTANVLTSLVRAKIITKNEAREKIEMNPVDEGDIFENPAIQVAEEKGPQGPEPENKIASIVATEAKKITAIFAHHKDAHKKEKAVAEFYDRHRMTLAKTMPIDEIDAYIETRLKEIGEAILAGTDVKEICTRWIEEAKK
jgi:hypothetical protein